MMKPSEPKPMETRKTQPKKSFISEGVNNIHIEIAAKIAIITRVGAAIIRRANILESSIATL
jgi:hypothetical protein